VISTAYHHICGRAYLASDESQDVSGQRFQAQDEDELQDSSQGQ
jgi:hypothetical protein